MHGETHFNLTYLLCMTFDEETPPAMKEHTSVRGLATDFPPEWLTGLMISCSNKASLTDVRWWDCNHTANSNINRSPSYTNWGQERVVKKRNKKQSFTCSLKCGLSFSVGISPSKVMRSRFVRLKSVSQCISHWLQYSFHHSLAPKWDLVA